MADQTLLNLWYVQIQFSTRFLLSYCTCACQYKVSARTNTTLKSRKVVGNSKIPVRERQKITHRSGTGGTLKQADTAQSNPTEPTQQEGHTTSFKNAGGNGFRFHASAVIEPRVFTSCRKAKARTPAAILMTSCANPQSH